LAELGFGMLGSFGLQPNGSVAHDEKLGPHDGVEYKVVIINQTPANDLERAQGPSSSECESSLD